MAYEPKTWNCGDTITADDLNHIEEGIANASGGGTASEPLIVNGASKDGDTTYYDKTLIEVTQALRTGRSVLLNDAIGVVLGDVYAPTHFNLGTRTVDFGTIKCKADSMDGQLYSSSGGR